MLQGWSVVNISKRTFVLVGMGLAVIGIVVVFLLAVRPHQLVTTIRIGQGVLTARVAVTDIEQQKGLGGVDKLAMHEAMLFTYSAPQHNTIWMKDMKIPIDAVWLDDEKNVVHIETALQPDSYPRAYGPSEPTRYIIELADGAVKEYNITLGTKADFTVRAAGEGV